MSSANPIYVLRRLAFVFLAAISCRSLTGACTLIGCSNGLLVTISSNPGAPWSVQVIDLETNASRTFTCNAGAPPAQCAPAFFPDFMPRRVRVVTVAGGFLQEDQFEPTYARRQPNGPDCPPTCTAAEVNVRFGSPTVALLPNEER